jgi:hypothetical protein
MSRHPQKYKRKLKKKRKTGYKNLHKFIEKEEKFINKK